MFDATQTPAQTQYAAFFMNKAILLYYYHACYYHDYCIITLLLLQYYYSIIQEGPEQLWRCWSCCWSQPGFCQPEVPQALENCGERSGKSRENIRTWEDDVQQLGKGYRDKKLQQQGSRWSYGGPFPAGAQPAQLLVVSRLRNPGLWRLGGDVNPHVICHWGKLKLNKHGVWCRQGAFIYIIHAKVASTRLPDSQHKELPSVRLST